MQQNRDGNIGDDGSDGGVAHDEEDEDVEDEDDVEGDLQETDRAITEALEAMRLNPALGNDPDFEEEEEDEEDVQTDSDLTDSDGPPPTDYTTYSRTTNSTKPQNHTRNTTGRVQKEAKPPSGRVRAGNAKGHKWKKNPSYLVGKSGADW